MNETWRPIPGFEGCYEASDQGRVRTVPGVIIRSNGAPQTIRGRIRSLGVSENGYLRVTLKRRGIRSKHYVHRLVMSAFVGPCPEGMEVLHGNGDRLDNALPNLRYGTRSENNLDAVRHGTNARASATHCPSGHEYSQENTRIFQKDGRNYRRCKTCRLTVSRNYQAKKKLAVQ